MESQRGRTDRGSQSDRQKANEEMERERESKASKQEEVQGPHPSSTASQLCDFRTRPCGEQPLRPNY